MRSMMPLRVLKPRAAEISMVLSSCLLICWFVEVTDASRVSRRRHMLKQEGIELTARACIHSENVENGGVGK
jgi:hypothetical protein